LALLTEKFCEILGRHDDKYEYCGFQKIDCV